MCGNLYNRFSDKLTANGFRPVRLTTPAFGGHPPRNWASFSFEPVPEHLQAEWKKAHIPYGVGLVLGHEVKIEGLTFYLIALDVDDDDVAEIIRPILPTNIYIRRGTKGFVTLMLLDGDPVHVAWKCRRTKRVLAEILGARRCLTIEPSLHRETHRPYRCMSEVSPHNTPASALPVIGVDLLEQIDAALCDIAMRSIGSPKELEPRAPRIVVTVPPAPSSHQERYVEAVVAAELALLAGMRHGRGRQIFRLAVRAAELGLSRAALEPRIKAAADLAYAGEDRAKRTLKLANIPATIESAYRKARATSVPFRQNGVA
jgi:hypothetical protein